MYSHIVAWQMRASLSDIVLRVRRTEIHSEQDGRLRVQLDRVRQVNCDVALKVDDITRLVAVNVDSVLEANGNLEAAAER